MNSKSDIYIYTERERDRDRQTDRQTDRQINGFAGVHLEWIEKL